MRKTAAWKLRDLASWVWKTWDLDAVRYLSKYDIAVIGVVARIDSLANRLDPPY